MDKIINLSLTRKNVPTRIDVVQYATKPSIIFVLEDFTPGNGATANLYIEKPDGTKIYNSCTISGNQITYKPTTQSFAALGKNKCQLQIIESNGTAVSFLIYADVTENIVDSSAIESRDEFTALEEALREVASYDSRGYWWNGKVDAGTDLNTVLTMGRYNFTAADNVANAPDGVTWGLLEVLRNGPSGTIVMQRITVNNRIYVRQTANAGSSWSAWQTFVPLATMDTWTHQTATYKGLTIRVSYNNDTLKLMRIRISGSTTEELPTANDYVTLATFSDLPITTSFLDYDILGASYMGQLSITTGGEVRLGYTRGIVDGVLKNIAANSGIYIDNAIITA